MVALWPEVVLSWQCCFMVGCLTSGNGEIRWWFVVKMVTREVFLVPWRGWCASQTGQKEGCGGSGVVVFIAGVR